MPGPSRPDPTPGSPTIDPPLRGMGAGLNAAAIVALSLAVIGSFLPGQAWLSGAAIGTIVAVPLLRVAVLAGHWTRRRDLGFAGLALLLLVVIAAGAAVAAAVAAG